MSAVSEPEKNKIKDTVEYIIIIYKCKTWINDVCIRNTSALRFQKLDQWFRKICYLCIWMNGYLFAVPGMIFIFRAKTKRWAVLAYPGFLLDISECPSWLTETRARAHTHKGIVVVLVFCPLYVCICFSQICHSPVPSCKVILEIDQSAFQSPHYGWQRKSLGINVGWQNR